MKNIFLYVITVLIWGSTWFAIEFQLGDVATEISLIYRFGLAAILILTLSKLKGLSLNFSIKQHLYIALLGLLNFCLNYFVLYEAQRYLTSAMTSIVFSMLLLFNIFNSRLFFGKSISKKTYAGATLGIAGIITLFWPEVSQYETSSQTIVGALLGLAGVLFASFGNMVSVRNSNRHYPVFQTSGWAMLYGTLFLTVIAVYKGTPFTISVKPSYLVSTRLFKCFRYGIAFYSYFYLMKSIGPEKTSYSIVLFPVVSVFISSIFEGFIWTNYTVSGFLLVAAGNIIMLLPAKQIQKVTRILTKVRRKKPVNPSDHCAYETV